MDSKGKIHFRIVQVGSCRKPAPPSPLTPLPPKSQEKNL
ncbi:hypothetical protein [Shigella phage ESh19]|nr:hypothetical protein [Shigella phage ESh19]